MFLLLLHSNTINNKNACKHIAEKSTGSWRTEFFKIRKSKRRTFKGDRTTENYVKHYTACLLCFTLFVYSDLKKYVISYLIFKQNIITTLLI